MNKKEAFEEINNLQDGYVIDLIKLMDNPDYNIVKQLNFTSATGTGKTKMMSKLINKLQNYFFIITTLSKGQLHNQIRANLDDDCIGNNYIVYGNSDFKINTKLKANDIISKIPHDKKCIWLRDEGHIKTNKFEEILASRCFKTVNFSATNLYSDIQCNFIQTMMLRTVNQNCGTPEDAINKLLEVKKAHKKVKNYNPCAIFRLLTNDMFIYDTVVELCKKYNLKYIDITNQKFSMTALCEDDNEYDVIINKMKIVEGIDIRRAHILYMDNQPKNVSTTIQLIGRCRRNALLYRNDIDIFTEENKELLKATRECFVFYNVANMSVATDNSGELQCAFCNYISCEMLNEGSQISVESGQIPNGLNILELEGQTGEYKILKDKNTGFNMVSPKTDCYNTKVFEYNNYVYCRSNGKYKKIKIENITELPLISNYNNSYFSLKEFQQIDNVRYLNSILLYFLEQDFLSPKYIYEKIKNNCFDVLLNKPNLYDISLIEKEVSKYFLQNRDNLLVQKLKKYFSSVITPFKLSNSLDKKINCRCSKNEILLIEYFCINKIKEDTSWNSIIEYIDHYINMKNKCYSALSITSEQAFIDLIQSKFNKLFSKSSDIPTQEKITYLILKYNINSVNHSIDMPKYPKFFYYPKINSPNKKLIKNFYKEISDSLDNYIASNIFFVDSLDIANDIVSYIKSLYGFMKSNQSHEAYFDFSHLFEPARYKEIPPESNIEAAILLEEFDELSHYAPYKIIFNDEESAIIGIDFMQQTKTPDNTIAWSEAKAVTTKVGRYSKFNAFISQRYQNELSQARPQLFSGKNNFKLDKKCNSMIGFCVEYYSKYLVYGEPYLHEHIKRAQSESRSSEINDSIIIRACIFKYKDLMNHAIGPQAARIIRTISLEKLIHKDYKYFVNLIVKLGTDAAKFINETLYPNGDAKDRYDPSLSIEHISGLADYITEDTIVDVKVRNSIDEKSIRQVLGYHYLSTKRSDLKIKRVIVYDATSNRSVTINISQANQIDNFKQKQNI